MWARCVCFSLRARYSCCVLSCLSVTVLSCIRLHFAGLNASHAFMRVFMLMRECRLEKIPNKHFSVRGVHHGPLFVCICMAASRRESGTCLQTLHPLACMYADLLFLNFKASVQLLCFLCSTCAWSASRTHGLTLPRAHNHRHSAAKHSHTQTQANYK